MDDVGLGGGGIFSPGGPISLSISKIFSLSS
jgi:hypothetical protein